LIKTQELACAAVFKSVHLQQKGESAHWAGRSRRRSRFAAARDVETAPDISDNFTASEIRT
jgi:hypothetical protein